MSTPEGGPPPHSPAVPPVGTRVVVRHRLPAPDPRTGATLTDVVGDLVLADAAHLLVRTRRGEVAVPRPSVTVVKEVPPRPSRRGAPHLALSVEDLERVMVGAWPAPETEHLGDWLLRAAGGFTHRANSVLAVGNPGTTLEAALDAAEDWYAARGLAPMLTLAGPAGFRTSEDALGRLLIARGYAPRVATSALTAGVDGVLAALPARPSPGVSVATSTSLSDSWFAAYRGYREAPEGPARAVLTGSPDQVFASAEDDEGVLGVGRLGVASAWGGVAAMFVEPRARRRGVASALLRRLAAEAADRGVRSLHLQTDTDNTAAQSLYRRAGFVVHHEYTTLRRP
ncbi:GNAT family N-acetyltransferase [Phycicoccus sp. MAQZ13P-2]|uniref:GNAT family N-acetyltransferase n=1 Tax=Phycicoccus mangrovi TaxID=2840470 RepID=UPI001C002186|nr:GNAT family N-acetyltransferase [Phycicoccus mangrovi]MBT9254010.1 GNAT family N-acetyltransferase [Phycicoccus mangrovi]MBT9275577.1 GNAT family N-acetyltransferase [Phycicoccus mangrovi]